MNVGSVMKQILYCEESEWPVHASPQLPHYRDIRWLPSVSEFYTLLAAVSRLGILVDIYKNILAHNVISKYSYCVPLLYLLLRLSKQSKY
jgi:hypothetical protein